MARLVLAALALASVAGQEIASASAPAAEGPRLAFTALSALKERGFSVGAIGPDGLGRLVLARGSRRGVSPIPFFGASWSSDGAWLAFSATEGRRKGIYKIRPDGSGLRFLRGTKEGRSPVFSHDGSKVAFARDRIWDLETTSWIARADGKGASSLTPWRKNVEYVPSSFSPDGSALAVTRNSLSSGKSVVLLFGLNGRPSVRVLARSASEAVFSPDGSQIALVRHTVSRRGKLPVLVNKDLYVMNADGTANRAVTRTHRIAETHPSWDPSGQRLAFNSFRMSKDPIEALYDELLPVGNSIVQVNADGTCRKKILSLRNAALYGAAWRPGANREAGRIEC